jgi:hypothetical protein
MAFLRISVDGNVLAVVSTAERDIVSVQVGGARIDEDFATLSVMGGIYDRDGVTDHRIWVEERALHAGQRVEVSFAAEDIESGPGATLTATPTEGGDADFTDVASAIADLRHLPYVRDRYVLRLESSNGASSECVTGPDEHGFGMSVLWNWLHPERASVSVHAYTLDSLDKGESGRDFVREKLELGGWVRLALVE